jgi:hypothetical protein
VGIFHVLNFTVCKGLYAAPKNGETLFSFHRQFPHKFRLLIGREKMFGAQHVIIVLAFFLFFIYGVRGGDTKTPTGQPTAQPSHNPTSRPTPNTSKILTSAPTTAGATFFKANIAVTFGGLSLSQATDTLSLSIRKAVAVTLGVPVDNVGTVTYATFSSRRRLLSGLTASYSVVVPATNLAAAQAAVASAFPTGSSSAGTAFASLVSAYATAYGQPVTITYIGATVAVTNAASPTQAPTKFGPGPIAGIVIASLFGFGLLVSGIGYIILYKPELLGLPAKETEPVPQKDPDFTDIQISRNPTGGSL